MRAEAKLVPACVVGAEEAAPVFAQVDFLQRLTGLIYFPITPTFPWLGPLGMLGYLPAKFKIRFLEPIDTVELGGAEAAEDKALVQTLAQEIRAQIQENLHDMLAKREVRLVGMNAPTELSGALAELAAPGTRDRGSSSPGCPPTGAAASRRPWRASSTIEAIVGVDSRRPDARARAHRVREGRQPALAARSASCEAAEIDTVIDTRLVVNSLMAAASAGAREQRDRDDEHPRRLRGPGLAGAQVRLQELDPLLRLPSRTTRPSSPRRCAGRTRRDARLERDMRRGRAGGRRVRGRNPRSR